jgi:hypothetical protein
MAAVLLEQVIGGDDIAILIGDHIEEVDARLKDVQACHIAKIRQGLNF